MKITRVLRLTLAVRDAPAAARTFETLIGAVPVAGPVPIEAFGVRALELALGDARLQLVSPLSADTALMRFLERRGEGFYNLALEVDDLDAAVRELADRGVRVSDPVEAEPGLRSAFVTMTATHGLSVQLIQRTAPGPPAAPIPASGDAGPADGGVSSPGPPVDGAASSDGEWQDAGAPQTPLDLTPDEWSDID
jgi:methylmalonyl-CoA/ethylmalonyl-CoA epimerase